MALDKPTAQLNFDAAKLRLSNKRIEIGRLDKQSIFMGVTIRDQFNVGRSGIKPFRKRRKAERRSALRQVGLSRAEIPMLQDELNLRKAELDFFDTPSMGDLL